MPLARSLWPFHQSLFIAMALSPFISHIDLHRPCAYFGVGDVCELTEERKKLIDKGKTQTNSASNTMNTRTVEISVHFICAAFGGHWTWLNVGREIDVYHCSL